MRTGWCIARAGHSIDQGEPLIVAVFAKQIVLLFCMVEFQSLCFDGFIFLVRNSLCAVMISCCCQFQHLQLPMKSIYFQKTNMFEHRVSQRKSSRREDSFPFILQITDEEGK
jgi:hypothetical protein